MNTPRIRLHFLDNIKVFLTMLVITHHVGQAYGPTGGFWQYVNSLGESIPWLGRFFGVNAAFFMGFFFMLSGYFFPRSYDSKGGKSFISDKLLRYGVPLLFALFIISPFCGYFYYSLYSGNAPLGFFDYYIHIFFGIGGIPENFIVTPLGFPERNFAHLWFVEHLMVYSVLYLLFRSIFPKFRIKDSDSKFTFVHLIVIAVVMSGLNILIRQHYSIDTWIAFAGFIQMEPAHIAQYFIMFVVGIVAYRKNWLSNISKVNGYIMLAVAILMAINFYVGVVPFWEFFPIYDSFFALFACWGLIVLFREHFYKSSEFMKILSRNSYAAYVLHFPIVLIVQLLFDKVVLGAVEKFVIVSIASIVVTYIASYLFLKIKFVNKIL